MKQQNPPATTPQSGTPVAEKLTYEPPEATFVPLKLEERLLTCAKQPSAGGGDSGKRPGPSCSGSPSGS